jgi:hypothetical protein
MNIFLFLLALRDLKIPNLHTSSCNCFLLYSRSFVISSTLFCTFRYSRDNNTFATQIQKKPKPSLKNNSMQVRVLEDQY